MKKLILILACALGTLTLAPSVDAAYRRSVVGYDSRGQPIVRVLWVADHLIYPRTIYARTIYGLRTYSTSGRRDPDSFAYPSSLLVYGPAYTYAPGCAYNPAYSAYYEER